MPPLPFFAFRSSDVSDEEAFEGWRELMAPVVTIDHNPRLPHCPRGELTSYLLGDVMATRIAFNGQCMARRQRLVDTTPDHLTFQFYHSGGFTGHIAGCEARLRRGLVVVADMRRQIDVRAVSSNTMGLSIPHHLLGGVDLRRPPPVLDPDRNRLLGARIVALHRDLPSLEDEQVDTTKAELLGFVRRLFDPSSARDVLDSPDLGVGVRSLAERVILRDLGMPCLSPTSIAEALRVSRATLYRAFVPDSVMDYVRACRLDAVHGALRDPTERRALAQVAVDHGFGSLSVLDRAYRARFGCTPRDTRADARQARGGVHRSQPDQLNSWWNRLGRAG